MRRLLLLVPILFLFLGADAARADDKRAPDAAWLVDLEIAPEGLTLALPVVSNACGEAQSWRDGSGYEVKICDQTREGQPPTFFVEVQRTVKDKGTVRLKSAVRLSPGKKAVLGRLTGPEGAVRVIASVSAQAGA
jgi:hypothetical protein